MDVCILLPTLNEAGSIQKIVRRVRKVNPSYAIYVVDSGSTDGTARLARQAGAKVISVPKGKGVAIKAVVRQVRHSMIVMLD